MWALPGQEHRRQGEGSSRALHEQSAGLPEVMAWAKSVSRSRHFRQKGISDRVHVSPVPSSLVTLHKKS